MPVRRTVQLVVLASIVGALLSVLLLLQHYNQAHDNALLDMMCGGEGTSGCDAVDESAYSSLFGIPLSAFGILFYGALVLTSGLALLAESATKERLCSILFFVAAAGLAADAVLLALQAFAIGAFCMLCIATYAATLVIVLLLWKYRSFTPFSHVRTLAAAPGGSMLVASWGAGLVLLAAGVFASNLALSLIDPTSFDRRLADIAYDEFRQSPEVSIDVADAPSVGPADAPIKIVVFSDFLCPWCKQLAENLQQNFPKWNDKVAVYYRSFPLDKFCNPGIGKTVHAGSCWLALGGVCAQEQGKFWEYHDEVYANQPRNPSGKDALLLAAQAGLDTAAMKACMMQTKNQGRVRTQIKQGASLGLLSTPVIYINGRRLPRIAYFSYVLRREAEQLGLPPLEGLDE